MSEIRADKIIRGKIYTLDAARSFAEAMAVAGGKVIYTGSLEGAMQYASPKTEIIERAGLILPAFTEGHAHVTCASEMILGIALGHEDEPQGYLNKISAWLADNPDAKHVFGSGYDNGVFGEEGPTAKLLDSICSDRPVVMIASDHHSRWLNSEAMRICGIDGTTPDPQNGEIVRDAQGNATGWLKETAMALANPAVPPMSAEIYAAAVEYYQNIALENGVANVFEPIFDSLRDYELRAEGYSLLEKQGKLLLTARLGYSLEADDDFNTAFEKMQAIRSRLESECEKVKMTTAKFFIDGVVECHTAFLRDNYCDAPNRGEPTVSPEMLNEQVLKVMESGFDVHTHVIGDAAADMGIEAYEKAQKKLAAEGKDGFRNILTHLQLIAPDAVARMAENGIIGVVNPYWHYYSPVYYEELEKPYLGEERAKKEYPMRALTDAGIRLAQASDFPVTVLPRTLDSIHLMVNRSEPNVENALTAGADQCLSLEQAIEIAALGGAYALRLEKSKGSLEAGKDADFVVISEDLFTMPKEKICTAEVLETYIGGKLCYKRN